MLLRGPARNEFVRIFETRLCRPGTFRSSGSCSTTSSTGTTANSGKVFRRCHPRDLLTHAVNLMHFEKLPYQLTAEVLDRAFESCFVQEEVEHTPEDAVIVQVAVKPCANYWSERAGEIDTMFGKLAFLASFRDRATGTYHDAAASKDYAPAELSQTLAGMHAVCLPRMAVDAPGTAGPRPGRLPVHYRRACRVSQLRPA